MPCILNRQGWGGGGGESEQQSEGKRSLSEFIKYQGNIAGTGSVSRAGALVPLITTDKKPGAEGGGGGGEAGAALPETLVLIIERGPSSPGPEVLKVKHTTAKAIKFRYLHSDHAHIITERTCDSRL